MDDKVSAVVAENEKEEPAVLVVGRGSSDPDANSDLSKIARLFYEGRRYPVVAGAHARTTPPAVAAAARRGRRPRASRAAAGRGRPATGVSRVATSAWPPRTSPAVWTAAAGSAPNA